MPSLSPHVNSFSEMGSKLSKHLFSDIDLTSIGTTNYTNFDSITIEATGRFLLSPDSSSKSCLVGTRFPHSASEEHELTAQSWYARR
jgi:hypothetical protein